MTSFPAIPGERRTVGHAPRQEHYLPADLETNPPQPPGRTRPLDSGALPPENHSRPGEPVQAAQRQPGLYDDIPGVPARFAHTPYEELPAGIKAKVDRAISRADRQSP